MILDRQAVTGLILAGGRGARMGHVDKGLQTFKGAPMVAQVLARLAPQVGTVAINANQNLARYGAFGAPVWPDDLGGFAGPLAGLATGMRRAGTPLLAIAPCDSPFLPDDLVARLLAALLAQGADLALAETVDAGTSAGAADAVAIQGARTHEGVAHEGITHEGMTPAAGGGAARVQPQPVFALVRCAALPHLLCYLANGGRRMDGWYDAIAVARVRFEQADAFRNINTLHELQQCESESASASASEAASASESASESRPNSRFQSEAKSP